MKFHLILLFPADKNRSIQTTISLRYNYLASTEIPPSQSYKDTTSYQNTYEGDVLGSSVVVEPGAVVVVSCCRLLLAELTSPPIGAARGASTADPQRDTPRPLDLISSMSAYIACH